MASTIKSSIIGIIEKNLDEKGIVLWYDPDEIYKDLVNDSYFKKIPIIIFDGSYFEVRFKAEKYFCDLDKNKILIYINKKRDVKNYPLIEVEIAGSICSQESSSKSNTGFKNVVKKALIGKVKAELIEDISRKIDEKKINLEEIEKLIENNTDITILSTIFDTKDPVDIILIFLCDKEVDKIIESKNSFDDTRLFFSKYFDYDLSNINNLNDLREKVSEIIFLSDFIISTRSNEILNKFKNLKLSSGEDIYYRINETVQKWRKTSGYSDQYISISEKIQIKYNIQKEVSNIKEIVDCETFKILDEILLKNVIENIDDIESEEIKDIINKRRDTFWVKNIPEYYLIWQIIESYFKLKNLINKADEIIKQEDCNLEDIFNIYVGNKDHTGWYLIDKNFRRIEIKFSQLDFGGKFDDSMDRLIIKCRNLYSNFLNNQIQKFVPKLKQDDIKKIKLLFQKDIYRKKVLPFIEEGKKCAYILIDALRYEMGMDLFKLLEDTNKISIEPAISGLPTSTEFGMLSLLLVPDNNIDLKINNGEYSIMVDSIKVETRADRIKYLEKKNSYFSGIIKLDQIIKPNKTIREKLKSSSLVIITSQEIDSIMEDGNDVLAKGLMDKIFIQIKRAVDSLSKLGFEKFIISSDHGFLLGSGIGKEHKVEVPTGKTYSLHKRYWAGLGGNNPENTIRFGASELGYDEHIDFVFPIGVSIFKTSGQENDYFHGGISLQELIIPVIELHKKPEDKKKIVIDREYKIIINKNIVTNRIFLLKISEEEKQLTIEDGLGKTQKKVTLRVCYDNEDVGYVIASEYGFIESTKEIMLDVNKSNAITIKLNEELESGFLDIILIDSETELELAKIEKLKFNLSI